MRGQKDIKYNMGEMCIQNPHLPNECPQTLHLPLQMIEEQQTLPSRDNKMLDTWFEMKRT